MEDGTNFCGLPRLSELSCLAASLEICMFWILIFQSHNLDLLACQGPSTKPWMLPVGIFVSGIQMCHFILNDSFFNLFFYKIVNSVLEYILLYRSSIQIWNWLLVFHVLKTFGKFWRILLANHLIKTYMMIIYSVFYQESFNFYAIFYVIVNLLLEYVLIYLLS